MSGRDPGDLEGSEVTLDGTVRMGIRRYTPRLSPDGM